MKESKDVKGFPLNLLEPIRRFLEVELLKMKRTKKQMEETDPFADEQRVNENSFEEDLDEQIGHYDN